MNVVFRNVIIKSLLVGLCILIFTNGGKTMYAQRYNFINYTTVDGLAQSQILSIAENNKQELFLASLGGISIFDGSAFSIISRKEGLKSNMVYDLAVDSSERIWFIGALGLGCIEKGNVTYIKELTEIKIAKLFIDFQQQIWALAENGVLYCIASTTKKILHQQSLIYSAALDLAGNIWCVKDRHKILTYRNDIWIEQHIETENINKKFVLRIFFGKATGNLYAINNAEVFVLENGAWIKSAELNYTGIEGRVITLFEDSKKQVWLTTDQGGCWMWNGNQWTLFNGFNGFSNERVTCIFEDKNNNIWLGVNGDGLYRYSGVALQLYNKEIFGLSNIISITQPINNTMYFSSLDRGVYMYKDNNIAPETRWKNRSVSVLTNGEKNVLYAYENNAGIWKYNTQSGYKELIIPLQQLKTIPTCLYYTKDTLWIGTYNQGIFTYANQKLEKLLHADDFIFSMHKLHSDSILLSGSKGVTLYLPSKKKYYSLLKDKQLTAYEIDANDEYIYIATDYSGLIILRRKDFKIAYHFTTANGLSNNILYGLLVEDNGNVWVGTRTDVDHIKFSGNNYQITSIGKQNGLQLGESNANTIMKDNRGNIWMSTTLGVFKYYPEAYAEKEIQAFMRLQNVKLFANPIPANVYSDSTLPIVNIAHHPVFPANKNHLTFEFKANSLTDASSIVYRYQLEGIDNISYETQQSSVVYPNLPPGNYVFKVWSTNRQNSWSSNVVSYPFEIKKPFTTTGWFRVGFLSILIGGTLGVMYWRNRQKQLKTEWEVRMREEEQNKIRQRTAEDFHDEVGNKLTRISLLSTILAKKLAPSNSSEASNIIEQIQSNVTQLYSGTKDIIWSLQPQSQYLHELLLHIQQNTDQLVDASEIIVTYDFTLPQDKNIKLPGDYSRNITMVCKEAVTNIVKHAQATQIKISCKETLENKFEILVQDNGIGMAHQQKNGNGLKNMKLRVQRINGHFEVVSPSDGGTKISIQFKIG